MRNTPEILCFQILGSTFSGPGDALQRKESKKLYVSAPRNIDHCAKEESPLYHALTNELILGSENGLYILKIRKHDDS